MSHLTKEQVQAFIDDLAYIRHKHGVAFAGHVVLHPDIYEDRKFHFVRCVHPNGFVDFTEVEEKDVENENEEDVVTSIDPSKVSAHKKMKIEEGLK